MKHKQLLKGSIAGFAMFILILDSKTAMIGASEGMELCIKIVIPSLFPFFVLSTLLTRSLSAADFPIPTPLARLYSIPKGSESILLSGYLGGYPVGAQAVSAMYHTGFLRREDAERMLAFCSNAGPAFLFGMIAPMFPNIRYAWVLWGIHIMSSLLVAITVQGSPISPIDHAENTSTSLPEAVSQAVKILSDVCGWVIVFRVFITFLKHWILWVFPTDLQILITGFLELSNGCCGLNTIEDLAQRFVLCSCILAFGGICVFMQTISVTNGLSIHFYILGKVLQTIFSLLISSAFAYTSWIPFILLVFLLATILRKNQKKSSIREPIGV